MQVADAWVEFAKNFHNREQSYRQDIDSSLGHLGFLYADGRITDLGYRYVDACERTGDPNSDYPLSKSLKTNPLHSPLKIKMAF